MASQLQQPTLPRSRARGRRNTGLSLASSPNQLPDFLGHRGLGSVAGYTKVSDQRHAEAAAAVHAKGV
jgi:hypothetical protein